MKRNKQEFPSFGKALAKARRLARWNQAEFAERAGVGQQTVSKWERGVIVPGEAIRQKLLAIFPEDVAATLRETVDKSGLVRRASSTLSTAARATRLNLDHLTAEQFQSFSADLLQALFPDATVNIYGVSGDAQEGIDIEVHFPEGYRYTAQCKRVKNFGPKKVREAVRAYTGSAKKKFLLISRAATGQTREAAKTYARQGWKLWDVDDISRKLRYLPGDKARVIVDAYAPSQRKDFLGIEQPSPFLAPNTFFRELLRPQAIFSHVWGIVGRSAELAELKEGFARRSAVVTIVGAGGAGKSRLALEFLTQIAASAPERPIRVLAHGATVAPADVEQYRDQQAIFLIEDAHDRDDVEGIVSLFRQLSPGSMLIVTTRPYGVERLDALLARQGLDRHSQTVPLRDLGRDDLERLATEILTARRFRTDLAKEIARLADRSPLFTVIASNLVAEKRMHPSVLSNEDAFKRQVLAHFRDVLTQALVRDSGEQSKARNYLNLVAVLQPLDLSGSEFAAALEALYKHPATDYDRVKQLLVDASVLVTRGGRARIVPDMLGDYILEQACSAVGGRKGSFPERVLSTLQPGQLRNVLHNLAKLDWRLTVQEGLAPRASAQIWRVIEGMYKDRGGARERILEAVESAAYFLPEQALEFLDSVESEPSGARVDRVCRIIRNAAYHRPYVRNAAERLWELGKNMPGQLNSLPGHPIRHLQALASIEPGKPIEYNQDILEFGLELLNRPDAATYAWSPFDFLEPILATEGDTHTSKGNAIVINYFTVNVETLAPLRRQLLDAAFRLAESPDLRLALRAVQMIGNAALRYPMGQFGNPPAEEARPVLEKEFVAILQRFEALVRRKTLDPLVVMEIVRAVSWHAGYAEGPTREAAEAVLQVVPKSFEQDLTECLVEGWGHHRERASGDPTRDIKVWENHQREVARALREQVGTVARALEVLRERLRVFASAGQAFHGQPHIFIRLLCDEWPDAARSIAKTALADPADPLVQYTEQGLGALLVMGPDKVGAIAKALLDTENADLKRRVAFAYGHSVRSGRRLHDEDVAMLERLFTDEDELTVRYAISALRSIAPENPPLAKALFFKTTVGESSKTADELASIFCGSDRLRDSFTPEDVKSFLDKLVGLAEIEDYWLQDMLSVLSGLHQATVLDFLLTRITQVEKDARGHSYRAIPFHWNQKARFKFRATGYLRTALARILALAREAKEHGWKERHAINGLFAAVAENIDSEVRECLSEYLRTADAYGVAAVSQVLSEMPSDFVFSDVEFVENFLRDAGRFGRERQEEAQFALYRAATTGMRSGTRGKPFPQDIALKQNAEAALARIRPGSPARKLFTWIRDHAQQQIERAHRDAELLEEEE